MESTVFGDCGSAATGSRPPDILLLDYDSDFFDMTCIADFVESIINGTTSIGTDTFVSPTDIVQIQNIMEVKAETTLSGESSALHPQSQFQSAVPSHKGVLDGSVAGPSPENMRLANHPHANQQEESLTVIPPIELCAVVGAGDGKRWIYPVTIHHAAEKYESGSYPLYERPQSTSNYNHKQSEGNGPLYVGHHIIPEQPTASEDKNEMSSMDTSDSSGVNTASSPVGFRSNSGHSDSDNERNSYIVHDIMSIYPPADYTIRRRAIQVLIDTVQVVLPNRSAPAGSITQFTTHVQSGVHIIFSNKPTEEISVERFRELYKPYISVDKTRDYVAKGRLKCRFQECSMQFAFEEVLDQHCIIVHSEGHIRLKYCTICERLYRYPNSIMSHIDRKHGDQVQTIIEQMLAMREQGISGVQPYEAGSTSP